MLTIFPPYSIGTRYFGCVQPSDGLAVCEMSRMSNLPRWESRSRGYVRLLPKMLSYAMRPSRTQPPSEARLQVCVMSILWGLWLSNSRLWTVVTVAYELYGVRFMLPAKEQRNELPSMWKSLSSFVFVENGGLHAMFNL